MLPATSMLEHWLVFQPLLWSLAQCDASKITVPIYKVLQYTRSLPHILARYTLQCDIRHFSEPLQEAFVKRTRRLLLVCTDVWGLAPITAPVRHTLVGAVMLWIQALQEITEAPLCLEKRSFRREASVGNCVDSHSLHLISDADSEVVKRELIWKTALTPVWAPSDFAFLPANKVVFTYSIQ